MTNPTERNHFGRACSHLPEDVTMEQRGELVFSVQTFCNIKKHTISIFFQ